MLYIVATPIGNLEDITLRGLRILKEAEVIICEDTRETVKLLAKYEIPHKPLISYYEGVEAQKLPDLLALVRSGQSVALVSDSGMPLISDPGYKLVRSCLEENLPVEVVPGPSAAYSALVLSGLPPDKFSFLGFLPEKDSHRKDLLARVKQSLGLVPATVICYVSPYKLNRDLDSLAEVFGDIKIVIIRELTKIHQERWTGTIEEAKKHFAAPKGEIVLLFHC